MKIIIKNIGFSLHTQSNGSKPLNENSKLVSSLTYKKSQISMTRCNWTTKTHNINERQPYQGRKKKNLENSLFPCCVHNENYCRRVGEFPSNLFFLFLFLASYFFIPNRMRWATMAIDSFILFSSLRQYNDGKWLMVRGGLATPIGILKWCNRWQIKWTTKIRFRIF